MRIQFKLLILLMSISLVPLLVVRTSVQQDLTAMSEDLAERSENILVHKASTGLQRIVEDHARVLRRERQLLGTTALMLASRIEGVISGHSHTPQDGDFIPSDAPLDEMRKEYFRLHRGDQRQPLGVDFTQTGSDGIDPGALSETLTPLLADVKMEYPKLVLWVQVNLESGTDLVYPKIAQSRMRGMQGMGMMRWSRTDDDRMEYTRLSWTLPKVDPRTGRMAFDVIAPIRDAEGNLQGNLTLVVPVDSVLHENHHVSMFSENAQSMLVQPESETEGLGARVQVVARERTRASGSGHWWMPQQDAWVTSEDKEQFGIMTEALRALKPGVVGMPYDGGSALWAHAPIDAKGTTLLLIVPRADIVRDAHAARAYVERQVEEHSSKIGYIVLVVAAFILVLSLVLSKVFTRNITELSDAVRSVAKGHFSVRAAVRSRDEVGQLAMAFNGMVPELQERVNLKNSLEVAQEVQQSLLPARAPEFEGVDVAASSSYCDETGGDYYGFIPRTGDRGEALVIAVGDVSGHGMQAALLMASVRAYLRSQLAGGAELNHAAAMVNELVAADVDETGRFMTLFLLELADGNASWVRAGHDPAMLYDPASDTFDELLGEGLPLGVMPGVEFEKNGTNALRSGQIIVIGTDGIWEMHSESGEMFGKERLQDLIRANADKSAQAIIAELEDALTRFRGQAAQVDDMTIAIIKID